MNTVDEKAVGVRINRFEREGLCRLAGWHPCAPPIFLHDNHNVFVTLKNVGTHAGAMK